MLKKVIATLLLLCTCVILVPCFDSNASAFSVNYAEPTTSDNQGYLLIELQDSSGNRMINTFFWNVNQYTDSGSMNSSVSFVIRPNSVTFNVGESGAYTGGDWLCGAYWNSGTFSVVDTRSYTQHFTYTYKYSGNTVVGFSWKGNVGGLTNYVSNNQTPSITFSRLDSAVKLQAMVDTLSSMALDNDTIIARLTSIMNNTDTVEAKLQSLIDLKQQVLNEQKETNTWLEKIFNYLNESQEKQKQEAQTQGNNSTSQGMDAIEDKGGDFAGSLGGLTNSMSYTGTQCAWEFPQVKLPAISGVMGEIVLIEKQPIDFAVWVNAIPSDILLVVQSVCTAGLIIYCFKELYDTIAYVLTLRKDDNS